MPDDRPIADGTVEKGPDGSTQVRFVRRLAHPEPLFEPIHQAHTENYASGSE